MKTWEKENRSKKRGNFRDSCQMSIICFDKSFLLLFSSEDDIFPFFPFFPCKKMWVADQKFFCGKRKSRKGNVCIVLPVQWILFFVFSTLLGSLFEPGNYANDRFSAGKKGGKCGEWSGVWRREKGGERERGKKFDKCSNVMEGRRKKRG